MSMLACSHWRVAQSNAQLQTHRAAGMAVENSVQIILSLLFQLFGNRKDNSNVALRANLLQKFGVFSIHTNSGDTWEEYLCASSSFSHSKQRPYPNPLRPKMAARCLQICQMEAIKVSMVIRGHGYKLFTASLVPFAGHRHSYSALVEKLKNTGLSEVTSGNFLSYHLKCANIAANALEPSSVFIVSPDWKSAEKMMVLISNNSIILKSDQHLFLIVSSTHT